VFGWIGGACQLKQQGNRAWRIEIIVHYRLKLCHACGVGHDALRVWQQGL